MSRSKRRDALAALQRELAPAQTSNLASERSELLATVVQRHPLAAASKPPSDAERKARARLAQLLRIRDKWGDGARVTVEDVERQRALVAQLEGKGAHEHGREQIRWLAAPVPLTDRAGVPGARIKVVGYVEGCRLPDWLRDLDHLDRAAPGVGVTLDQHGRRRRRHDASS